MYWHNSNLCSQGGFNTPLGRAWAKNWKCRVSATTSKFSLLTFYAFLQKFYAWAFSLSYSTANSAGLDAEDKIPDYSELEGTQKDYQSPATENPARPVHQWRSLGLGWATRQREAVLNFGLLGWGWPMPQAVQCPDYLIAWIPPTLNISYSEFLIPWITLFGVRKHLIDKLCSCRNYLFGVCSVKTWAVSE